MSKLVLNLLSIFALGFSLSLKSMEENNHTQITSMTKDNATHMLACGFRHLDKTIMAFAHGANPNYLLGNTPLLIELIEWNRFSPEDEKDLPDIVREFAKQPDLTQELRDRALRDAARRGLAKTVRVLLQGGANVHTLHEGCHKDWTALHFAAKYDHLAAVKVLVEEGHANIHALDAKGNTPVTYTNREILDYFEDQKRLSQKTWRTFTHLAREAGKTSLGRSLIEHQKEAMSAAVLLFIIFIMYTMNCDKA